MSRPETSRIADMSSRRQRTPGKGKKAMIAFTGSIYVVKDQIRALDGRREGMVWKVPDAAADKALGLIADGCGSFANEAKAQCFN